MRLNLTAPLAAQIATAAATVEKQAEAALTAFTGTGLAQVLLSREKATEAADLLGKYATEAAFTAAALTDVEIAAAWPFLHATATVAGADAWQIAVQIGAAAGGAKTASVAIERTRLAAQKNIASATDGAAIAAVLAGISWPQPS